MATRNKVQDVLSASSDLLRNFEDTAMFSPPEISRAQQENEPEQTQARIAQSVVKTHEPKSPKRKQVHPKIESPTEGEKILKRPYNLYLSNDDIQYLENLSLVLGSKPTRIVKAWIVSHRESKGEEVEKRLAQIKKSQDLL